MKIAIAVHGRFHAFDLARELSHQGASVSLATTYPAFIARRFLPPHIELRTALALELARRAAAATGYRPPIDAWMAKRFGRFAARALPGAADVFVGWSGASLEATEVARRRGMRIVIERGSTHIAHQAKVLDAERARHGIGGAPSVDDRLVSREIAEYATADAIMVPTRFAAKTFIQQGIDPAKLVVNPYGVDLRRYATMPTERPHHDRLRVLFVGRVGLRKGVPYLIEAARRMGSHLEVHLVGPEEPEIRPFLAATERKIVRRHGPLRGQALDACFRDADIFCLPSLEEGLPLSLLQAMAAGLPAVVTPETGAEDVIEHGRDGLVVPARDPDGLVAAFDRLLSPDLRISLGASARIRARNAAGWREYGVRAMTAYRRLLH